MTVIPIFHLFFMHWRHYPPIWMSPSDYQSFIYFRAVSHKKRVYKSVTCHRFLPSLLLEPVCWVTPVTRVFSFLWRGLSPLSPIGIAKKMDIYFSFYQQFAFLDCLHSPWVIISLLLSVYLWLWWEPSACWSSTTSMNKHKKRVCHGFTTRPLFMFVLV